MKEEEFPFKEQVVQGDKDPYIPEYLHDQDIDFSCVNAVIDDSKAEPIKSDQLAKSGIDFEGLDKSQADAIVHAFTHHVSLIQGPPGTGKTFVGVRIAQILLSNKHLWKGQGPIFVVCYTNHALDQFLSLIVG